MKCSEPGCENELKDNAWARIKSGWFFQRNGSVWCPAHNPPWVAEWRKRKAS